MTFEELKKARFVEHHKCGGCGSPVGYEIHPEFAAAVFQSGCDCGGTYPNYRLLTHDELAQIPARSVEPISQDPATQAQVAGVLLMREGEQK